jgi:hypothetical protein
MINLKEVEGIPHGLSLSSEWEKNFIGGCMGLFSSDHVLEGIMRIS